jgi:hypothetical protein
MIERVIEEQDPYLLLSMSDEECKNLGGCRYIITQLHDKVPMDHLEDVIRQRYESDEAMMTHMLGFLKTHIILP